MQNDKRREEPTMYSLTRIHGCPTIAIDDGNVERTVSLNGATQEEAALIVDALRATRCKDSGHVWVGTGDERVVCGDCGAERETARSAAPDINCEYCGVPPKENCEPKMLTGKCPRSHDARTSPDGKAFLKALTPPDLFALLQAAGYDTALVHHACYRKFCYLKFVELVVDEYAKLYARSASARIETKGDSNA